ncbi:hypothetical protein AeRB84_017511 [Aphanomyces euteiches]|nr:hypothetical protein AeRB84_017511 [Aphanomyces euteiches]
MVTASEHRSLAQWAPALLRFRQDLQLRKFRQRERDEHGYLSLKCVDLSPLRIKTTLLQLNKASLSPHLLFKDTNPLGRLRRGQDIRSELLAGPQQQGVGGSDELLTGPRILDPFSGAACEQVLRTREYVDGCVRERRKISQRARGAVEDVLDALGMIFEFGGKFRRCSVKNGLES